MVRYVLRRLPSAVVVAFVASVVIFAVVRLVPGDPAAELAGSGATPATVAALRAELGLNRPVVHQYFSWLGHVLTFNFGKSLVLGGSVRSLVLSGLGNTLVLSITALVIAIILALAASISSVVLDRRWLDTVVTAASSGAIGIPSFVTGTVFVIIFAVALKLLPAAGTPDGGFLANISRTVSHLVLPAVCLALPLAAALTRFLRESLQTQMQQPYVTTARALGISRRRIVITQALRNALPTTVTVLGIQIGALLGGTVLVESIFAWPGLGRLLQQAVLQRDYPVIQTVLVLAVVVFVAAQLLTDIVNAYLDPRIRLGGVG